MTRNTILLLPLLLLVGPLAAQKSTGGERRPPGPLSESEFDRLHATLSPQQQGKWEQIPWMTDLLAARRRAIAERKPLFMWSMNGHPLGCT